MHILPLLAAERYEEDELELMTEPPLDSEVRVVITISFKRTRRCSAKRYAATAVMSS